MRLCPPGLPAPLIPLSFTHEAHPPASTAAATRMTILGCPGVAVATDPTGVRAGADDTENWIEALASKCGRPMVRMDTVAHTVGTREGEYELGRNRPLDL